MNLSLIKFEKKIFYYFFIIIINYFLITATVFFFSYISLLNGKIYDSFWLKSIQKKIYFEGFRNIWQFDNNCTIYDKDLLYKPKSGECEFSNPEFKTNLKFDNFKRIHKESNNNDLDEFIVVLGDSIAMGWGVNNDETFSFLLEKKLKKKVYNLGVSSYGTVREIKRLKKSPYYLNSKTIIVQYHTNDLGENKNLEIEKNYSKKKFDEIYENQSLKKNNIKFIMKTFGESLPLLFSDIGKIIFKEKKFELIDFEVESKYLEKVLEETLDTKEKRIIIIFTIHPEQKVINFPQNNDKFEYILIQLKKSEFFIIDDHPNFFGHKAIANKLTNYLKLN